MALSILILIILLLGLLDETNVFSAARSNVFSVHRKKKDKYQFPDFNKYKHTRTISKSDLGLDAPDKRVIVIGDIHGMNRSLHDLLSTLSVTESDTVLLTGDIVAKSTHAGSLAILDFLSQHNPDCASASGVDPNPKPKSRKAKAKAYTSASKRGRVYAVRGNHDQMVVQWRAWREWFEPQTLSFASSSPGLTTTAPSSCQADAGPPVNTGREFLALIEKEWLRERARDPTGGTDPDEWADVARKRAAGTWRAEWWRRIPQPGKGRAQKDWMMFRRPLWLSRDMTSAQAACLFMLPLVLHIPSQHFFIVHAGLLPLDPRRPSTDERQPLAHLPQLKSLDTTDQDDEYDDELDGAILLPPVSFHDVPAQSVLMRRVDQHFNESEEMLRMVQEKSVLRDVPHNRDPWAVLNMRGVRKNGKVTRLGDKGTPWSKIWNSQMKRCSGFDAVMDGSRASEELPTDVRVKTHRYAASGKADADDPTTPLPCHPSTVVYGHAASRGLDIKRWSVGLDTGCLYGRQLTALVLQRKRSLDSADETSRDPVWDEDDEDEDDDNIDEDVDEDEDAIQIWGLGGHLRFNPTGQRSQGDVTTRKRKAQRRSITFGTNTLTLGLSSSASNARRWPIFPDL
ncbi:hypothetical protein A0H81_07984 [Grifola frondosa]|uniref:Calcineurin-like phosphoesterase domain-containing protein n=1 Tax=Grifola frondosa TaxID=5627 RepID=A0A1C7M7L1_GRIFR|nr:hypothetical protein A0H81_07984 [Grifola frondosa]